MDISAIAAKLSLPDSKALICKAEELCRLCDVQFASSIIGVGEVLKAIICLEIAASRLQLIFDRSAAIWMSGMSEKAYIRSFNAMQNGIGVKTRLDVRELAIQFGCVRLVSLVQKGLSHSRLTSSSLLSFVVHQNRNLLLSFVQVANSMTDLCFDVIGISKEKKDPRAVKGHQELLEALPGKRMRRDHSVLMILPWTVMIILRFPAIGGVSR